MWWVESKLARLRRFGSSNIHNQLLPNKLIPDDFVIFGEIGLTGELRPVANGQERLREAQKHGFKRL